MPEPAKRRCSVDTNWTEVVTALSVFALAIVSPGPNFLLVLNRTLADSRKAGLFTALGVATGSGIFAAAGFVGLILVLGTHPHFQFAIRILGGSYLAWLGISIVIKLLSGRRPSHELTGNGQPITPAHAYRSGLITNLTNPKAWAFYMSLFALVVSPTIPMFQKGLLILIMFLISLSWYGSIALLLSYSRIRTAFLRWQPLIQALIALLLVSLGINLLFMD